MLEGSEKKLLNSCIKEVIIYNFHKRFDRLRISVAIIAVKICNAAVNNEDRSLSANQTKCASPFSFSGRQSSTKLEKVWVINRVLIRVLIALIREITTRNRDGFIR